MGAKGNIKVLKTYNKMFMCKSVPNLSTSKAVDAVFVTLLVCIFFFNSEALLN